MMKSEAASTSLSVPGRSGSSERRPRCLIAGVTFTNPAEPRSWLFSSLDQNRRDGRVHFEGSFRGRVRGAVWHCVRTRAGIAPACPKCQGEKLEKQLSVFAVSVPASSGNSSVSADSPCASCGVPGGPGRVEWRDGIKKAQGSRLRLPCWAALHPSTQLGVP